MNEFLAQTATDFEVAADVLESGTLEWCQGSLGHTARDGDQVQITEVCAVGALCWAIRGQQFLIDHLSLGANDDSIEDAILDADAGFSRFYSAREVLDSRIESYTILEEWNDADDRTKQEVIDLFKAAAKDLRNDYVGN
jgi:hypothetical protein